jgi:hypothetical protein
VVATTAGTSFPGLPETSLADKGARTPLAVAGASPESLGVIADVLHTDRDEPGRA